MTNLFVFDTETSISKGVHGPEAKDPNNDFYTVIAGNSADNVKIWHKEGGFNRQIPAEAVEMLKVADVFIGHNLPFDLSYIWECAELKEYILRGGQFWDTQIAEYLMSGQRHSTSSLAELQVIYLDKVVKPSRISNLYKRGIGADKIVKKLNTHKRLAKLYNDYCLSDGATPIEIFLRQYQRAKELGMLKVIKLYNRYMVAIVNTMCTGIPVDMEKCQETYREFKLKSIHYLEQAAEIVKPYWDERLKDFNINSSKDKSAILFGGTYIIKTPTVVGVYKNGNEKIGKVEEEVTIKGFGLPTSFSRCGAKKDQYSTDEDVINRIYRDSDNEIAKRYCELQKQSMKYNKMCNTYLSAFLEKSVNGNLFPNFNNTTTITGRLSASKPNMQNIPSKGGMETYIQGQLTCPKGWKCVSADFSQLEIYVLAFLSGDQCLVNDLKSGIDFHVKRLSYAEDMPYEEVYDLCKVQKLPEWDAKRTAAKTISYQKAYGAAPKSLAESTGLDEAVIQKIFDKEDIEYTEVSQFNKRVLECVNNNQEYSLAKNLPASKKRGGINGKKFLNGIELLPIIFPGNVLEYNPSELRKVGYYQCITGRRYAFEEIGRLTKFGLRKGYSHTQTKNYHIQGTAGDIQAASSASLLKLLLKNQDKVKMVNEIHDSKWFLVKEEYLPQILPIIRGIMEDVPGNFKEHLGIDMPFKIPVDFKIGENFAEMTTYEVTNDKYTRR